MKVTLNMLFKMYGKFYSVYFHPVASRKHPKFNNSHLVALCTIIQIPSNPFLVGLAASAMLAVNVLIFPCISHDNSHRTQQGSQMTVKVMCKGQGGSRSAMVERQGLPLSRVEGQGSVPCWVRGLLL